MQVCPICKSDQLTETVHYLEGFKVLRTVVKCSCCGFSWKKPQPLSREQTAHYINQ